MLLIPIAIDCWIIWILISLFEYFVCGVLGFRSLEYLDFNFIAGVFRFFNFVVAKDCWSIDCQSMFSPISFPSIINILFIRSIFAAGLDFFLIVENYLFSVSTYPVLCQKLQSFS